MAWRLGVLGFGVFDLRLVHTGVLLTRPMFRAYHRIPV